MKKHLPFFISALLLWGCNSSSQKEKYKEPDTFGSIHGSVSYFYNKFVGDRPDVGDVVVLTNSRDTSRTVLTHVDVRGDFSFEHIGTGSYYLVVLSDHVRNSPKDAIDNVYYNSPYINGISGFVFTDSLKMIRQKVHLFDSLDQVQLDPANYKNYTKKYHDSLFKFSIQFFHAIPQDMKSKMWLIGTSKTYYNLIDIKETGNQPIVINFGSTYD